jgi:hypothetical protein
VHHHDLGAGDVAAVLSDALDVVRATHRWRALHAPLGTVTNLAHAVFTHPAAPWFYLDLAQVQVSVVAQLRSSSAASDADADPAADPAGPAGPGALAAESDRFLALWTGLAVVHRPRAPYEVRHPAFGRLALDRRTTRRADGTWCERLVPRAGGGGSRDAAALALLDLI